jgi:hypothetical protein
MSNLKSKLEKTASDRYIIYNQLYDIFEKGVSDIMKRNNWTNADDVYDMPEMAIQFFDESLEELASKIDNAINEWEKDTRENYPDRIKQK